LWKTPLLIDANLSVAIVDPSILWVERSYPRWEPIEIRGGVCVDVSHGEWPLIHDMVGMANEK